MTVYPPPPPPHPPPPLPPLSAPRHFALMFLSGSPSAPLPWPLMQLLMQLLLHSAVTGAWSRRGTVIPGYWIWHRLPDHGCSKPGRPHWQSCGPRGSLQSCPQPSPPPQPSLSNPPLTPHFTCNATPTPTSAPTPPGFLCPYHQWGSWRIHTSRQHGAMNSVVGEW